MSIPAPREGLAVTVAESVADELIMCGGLTTTEAGWLLPDGTSTTDPRIALTSSLNAIAEKSRVDRVIEVPADIVNEVRVGLNALAASSISSRQNERVCALLDVVGSEAATDTSIAVELDLHQHRLTLVAALYTRIQMLGFSDEEENLCATLDDVMMMIDRREDSEWNEKEGSW